MSEELRGVVIRKRRRPWPKPLAVDAKGLAAMLSLGLRTIRSADAAGKLPPPVRVGGRVLWRVDEIRDWLDAGAPDRATWDALKATKKSVQP